ncbi:MAG: glycosyltransferase family 2 protein, partial [Pirellulales bacterium]|nr:glycosyltransferase family 2 protein [Pirellulales bacterium]
MRVSFLIRTLNEIADLPAAIERIEQQRGDFDTEIIVVDSGSDDGTREYAENHTLCELVPIAQSEWSWGSALNLGMSTASANYVVVISAHCLLYDDAFLQKATELLQSHELAAVYGRQYPILNNDPFEEYELAAWYPDKDYYPMSLETICAAEGIGVSNACCVVRKQIWEQVGYREELQSME